MTYDQVAGDLSQANYSSLRAGKIKFRRLCEQIQYGMLIPMLVRPIADRFHAQGALLGLWGADVPDGMSHVPPAHEMIDPLKDTTALIAQVRAGFVPQPEAVGTFGYDFRQVVEMIREANVLLDDAGISLDTDPRRVAKSGAPQDADNESNETEVGAADGTLRLWLAKEALRQGELRLAGQALTLQAMETRATSLLTWSVTVGVALVAASIDSRFRDAAVSAFTCSTIAASACVWGMWPRSWRIAGQRFSDMERRALSTELEHLASMAQGVENAAEANEARVKRFASALRVAWVSVVAAPVVAAVVAGLGRL